MIAPCMHEIAVKLESLYSIVYCRFAMEEAVFALARLFQRYTFSLSAEHHKNPVITRANITLPPRDGIWVKVHPRTTAHG